MRIGNTQAQTHKLDVTTIALRTLRHERALVHYTLMTKHTFSLLSAAGKPGGPCNMYESCLPMGNGLRSRTAMHVPHEGLSNRQ